MRLLNFTQDDGVAIGILTDKGIFKLEEVGRILGVSVPDSMEELIRNTDLMELEKLVDVVVNDIPYISEDEITYMPVLTHPDKIICVGLNYMEHVEETKGKIPEEPIIFSKFSNALAAHNEEIPLPRVGKQIDYEAELVVVIGKDAQDVPKEKAMDYVFGYTIGNDLSVRDLQFKEGHQWLLGKTADKFAPVGPYIVTRDEIDPSKLEISLRRNGELVQSSNTRYMIFDVATIVSYLSKRLTLKAGDLIFTGTPEGVILGLPEGDRTWLKVSEVLEVQIEGIGSLKNQIGIEIAQ